MQPSLFGCGRRMTAAVSAVIALVLGGVALSGPVAGAAVRTRATAPRVASKAPCSGYLPSGSVVGAATTPDDGGYWIVNNAGYVVDCGDAVSYGSLRVPPNKPIVGIAASRDGRGYYLVASDGGVFAFGDAVFRGSTGALVLNKPVVGIGVDPSTGGYWLVASDGGVFSFGAPFRGSTGSLKLNKPVVGMAASSAGTGYWLVASDGGVFAFHVPFRGSMGSVRLNKPVVGMAVDAATTGYWLVASDGGIFSFGAPFFGSTGDLSLNKPVVGMEAPGAGTGYRFVASDGGIFTFGSSRFFGSAVSPLTNGVCTATVSNSNPRRGDNETVSIRSTVPNGGVVVTTKYLSRSNTYSGRTDASGSATVSFDIDHPKIDYRIGVTITVNNGEAICTTSFTAR